MLEYLFVFEAILTRNKRTSPYIGFPRFLACQCIWCNFIPLFNAK